MRYFIRLTLLLTVALIAGSIVSYVVTIHVPVHESTEQVAFLIEKGEGPKTIASKLKQAGLLRDVQPFLISVLISGRRNKFYPGSYSLVRNSTISQLIHALTDEEVKQNKVTLLEGWRVSDIAAELAKKTSITAEQFIEAAPASQYEGYLFPDTYYFTKETTAVQAVKRVRDNFDRKTKKLTLAREDIILASIIEREAQNDEDRVQVAGVYTNRLKIGMALQADPTVQYAKGSWDPITVVDYRAIESPYNTYLHKGLPPGPISNPGLASLKAVKQPAVHDYLFFFHASDGKTYYARTLEEHNANKAKYLK